MSQLCRIAGISRKTYYHRNKGRRQHGDALFMMKELQIRNDCNLGSRRMAASLRMEYGMKLSRETVRRLMRENDIQAKQRRRKFPDDYYRTVRENRKNLPRNIVNRHFCAFRPGHVLLTDITYLHCREGFCYLSAIKDVFDNRIVSYCFSMNCNTELCNLAVEKYSRKNGVRSTVLHSDQGSTYTSHSYRELLKSRNFIQSMSRRGNCWDNAPMESFFGILKSEGLYSVLGRKRYKDGLFPAKRIIETVIHFIEKYNRERLQEDLGWRTPEQYNRDNIHGTAIALRQAG